MHLTTEELNQRLVSFEQLLSSSKLNSLSSSELLIQSNRFKKVEEAFCEKNKDKLITKRIAIVASYSTQHFLNLLKLFLYQQKVRPIFYEAEYNSIFTELLDPNSGLYQFKPELLITLPLVDDIKEFPELFSNHEQVENWAKRSAGKYLELWKTFYQRTEGCQILQGLFVNPIHRQLGNLEANYIFSRSNCIDLINLEFKKQKPSYVTLIDTSYLASFLGKAQWFDEVNYFISKQGMSMDGARLLSRYFSRIIAAHAGRVKKCLVLDLDQTLWGGVVGDDGVSGINLDPNHPIGEAYLSFQKHLKALKHRGVLLAVCSKNNDEIARKPFTERPECILKADDFVAFLANWNDKSSNLMEIAKQLNIGLDSLVFFDDNPAERALVQQFTPEVEVIDVPEDPAHYVRALESSYCFEWGQLSKEDMTRSSGYVAERQREELKAQSFDYDSYLKSLELKATVGSVNDATLPRFCQLINKSNQFNLRTQRFTEAAIEKMVVDPSNYRLLQIDLSDKFTQYGLISSIIVQKVADYAFINTWVMSCRVLKRGVEKLTFNLVSRAAQDLGCKWIAGEYIETPKNGLVKDLYSELGLELTFEQPTLKKLRIEGSLYVTKVENFKDLTHFIGITTRQS